MIPLLTPNTPFPPLSRALQQPNGLLAAGGDLSPSRLLDAYRRGIFPWFNPDDPILWWSPNPRMVLFPRELHLSHSLLKTLRKGEYSVRTNSPAANGFATGFEQVIRACSAPRDGANGTWIVEEMIAAYLELHRLGHAHSVEVWMNNELVGGLYGVAIGRMFYGESMFSLRNDASKIAFAHLARQLERWGFGLIDCQMYTAHLASLGAREIPRAEFITQLQELINCKPILRFQFDCDLFA
ncbi:MAG: leucyl/phenylalanyl-tRNA--protein transferase [Sideroxydans sp.]